MMTAAKSGLAAFIVSLCSFITTVPASALELEQARESCRNSIGRPTYMACKQSGGPHEACMARAKAAATPCVRNAMMAARPKAALFDAAKVSAPKKEDIAAGAAALGPLAGRLRGMLDPGCRLAGCSTAGELVATGYSDGGALAIVFPRAGFAVETVSLADLGRAGVTQ